MVPTAEAWPLVLSGKLMHDDSATPNSVSSSTSAASASTSPAERYQPIFHRYSRLAPSAQKLMISVHSAEAIK